MIVASYLLENGAEVALEAPIPARPYLGPLLARDPLGFGLLEPFQRNQQGDLAAGSGARLVATSIAAILGTEASTPDGSLVGELPWRPEFGSLLHLLKHRPVTDLTTQQIARAYVAEAIRRWEPRVSLVSVTVKARASQSGGNLDTLAIGITYNLNTGAQNGVALPPIEQVVLLTREAVE